MESSLEVKQQWIAYERKWILRDVKLPEWTPIEPIELKPYENPDDEDDYTPSNKRCHGFYGSVNECNLCLVNNGCKERTHIKYLKWLRTLA